MIAMGRVLRGRTPKRAARVAGAALALSLVAACSSVPDITQINVPKVDFSDFTVSDWNVFAKTSPASVKPVSPEDFVDPQGQCAGTVAPAPEAAPSPAEGAAAAPAVPRGIALGMAECEVVRATGQSPRVEIAANDRGDRTVIMTYDSGDHAGIYRFVAGRLVSMERNPQAVATKPTSKKKPVAKKQTRKPPSA
jgi:hypothetical protein